MVERRLATLAEVQQQSFFCVSQLFFFHYFRIALNFAKERMRALEEQCHKQVHPEGDFFSRSMEDVGPVGQSESLLLVVFLIFFANKNTQCRHCHSTGTVQSRSARSARPRGQKWKSPGEHQWRLGASTATQRFISKAKVANGYRSAFVFVNEALPFCPSAKWLGNARYLFFLFGLKAPSRLCGTSAIEQICVRLTGQVSVMIFHRTMTWWQVH